MLPCATVNGSLIHGKVIPIPQLVSGTLEGSGYWVTWTDWLKRSPTRRGQSKRRCPWRYLMIPSSNYRTRSAAWVGFATGRDSISIHRPPSRTRFKYRVRMSSSNRVGTSKPTSFRTLTPSVRLTISSCERFRPTAPISKMLAFTLDNRVSVWIPGGRRDRRPAASLL